MIEYSTLSEAWPNYKKKKEPQQNNNEIINNSLLQQPQISNSELLQPPQIPSNKEPEPYNKPDFTNIYQEDIKKQEPPIFTNNIYQKKVEPIKSYNDDIDEYLIYNNKKNDEINIIDKLKEIKTNFVLIKQQQQVPQVPQQPPQVVHQIHQQQPQQIPLDKNEILYNLLILLIIGFIIILLCEQITKIIICKTIEKYNLNI